MKEFEPKTNSDKGKKPLGRTYAGINLGGREAIRDDSIPAFKEFGKEFEKRFNVWVEFDENSEKTITEHIINSIEKIEDDLSLKFFLAIRDFQLHSSILQGEYLEESGQKNTDAVYAKLIREEKLKEVTRSLKDIEIPFKYLLFDKKGTIILTSVKIPETIPLLREDVTMVFQEEGLTALPIDILHITIGRLHEKADNERLKQFEQSFRNLRHSISATPLVLKIKDVNLALGGVAKGGTTEKL